MIQETMMTWIHTIDLIKAVMVIKGILAGSIEASQGCTQGAIVQRREIAGHMFASLG